jgi:hypothetical protein
MLFFQCYPTFRRFDCKVFLTEALRYFGGAAARTMIDNTHVVVLRGSGRDMVEAYRKTPGTAGTIRRPDRVLATPLYQRGVSVSVIENAFVLAAARRRCSRRGGRDRSHGSRWCG